MMASETRGVRFVAILFAAWSLPALLMVAQMFAIAMLTNAQLPTPKRLLPALAEWYMWVPMTPIIWRWHRRFPLLVRTPRPSAWVAHLSGVAICAALRGTLYGMTSNALVLLPANVNLLAVIGRISIGWLPFAAVICGAIIATDGIVQITRTLHEAQVSKAQLAAQLATTQLQSLRGRLHPHFFFNALHAVSALVRQRNTVAATDLIEQLGDFMRDGLRDGLPDLVPLDDEVRRVERYLAIELVRFRDRLNIEWSVAEDIRSALVPSFLLQTFAENAVVHGVARSTERVQLTIQALRRGNELTLSVTDDAVPNRGHENSTDYHVGSGLETARSRLALLYGPSAALTVETRASGGTRSMARIPVTFERASLTAN